MEDCNQRWTGSREPEDALPPMQDRGGSEGGLPEHKRDRQVNARTRSKVPAGEVREHPVETQVAIKVYGQELLMYSHLGGKYARCEQSCWAPVCVYLDPLFSLRLRRFSHTLLKAGYLTTAAARTQRNLLG
ncbi:uncharacterized protein LOC144782607 [Lissotriton helveticus]